MSVLMHRQQLRRMLGFILILCCMLPSGAMAVHLNDHSYMGINYAPFSMLILGDSQMAGSGWNRGYANCILEVYPNAQVLNLAQNGSLLSNGGIYEQWEFYLSEDLPMPDFILLDGGVNDLFNLKKEEYDNESIDLVHASLRSLIEQIHAESPDTRIIYTLMPPLVEWEDSEKGPPSYDVQDIYWKQINIIASAYKYVTVLDLFSLNPFRFPCKECYKEYFSDSIHLSEAGYRKTFEYLDNILVVHLAKTLDD